MTCIYCKYQFCWLCMEKYDCNHYGIYSNCYGLQNSNKKCFSNRLCIFLYNLLFLFLKNIAFVFLAPFITFIYIFKKIYHIFIKGYISGLFECLSYCSLILLCLSLYGSLVLISGFISFLMFIIWPLHKKIFEIINNY